MSSSRIWGALLCIVSAMIAAVWVLEAYLGLFFGSPRYALVILIPLSVIILVATGLGFWLGWIMVTTKEAEPAGKETVREEGPDSPESEK